MLEDDKKRKWINQAKNAFDEYALALIGQESVPENEEEVNMKEFYRDVVEKTAPKLYRDKDGKLRVKDIPLK